MDPKQKELKLMRQILADQRDHELVVKLIGNPVVQIIGTYVVIEALQKAGIMPSVAGTVAEGAVVTAIAFQQLSPMAPELIAGGSRIVDSMIENLGRAITSFSPGNIGSIAGVL